MQPAPQFLQYSICASLRQGKVVVLCLMAFFLLTLVWGSIIITSFVSHHLKADEISLCEELTDSMYVYMEGFVFAHVKTANTHPKPNRVLCESHKWYLNSVECQRPDLYIRYSLSTISSWGLASTIHFIHCCILSCWFFCTSILLGPEVVYM